eukprot:6175019-Pleurochrysis_carterae.AAC.1
MSLTRCIQIQANVGQHGDTHSQKLRTESLPACNRKVEQHTDELRLAAQENVQSCLCVFDVDRTLTGKQGARSECPRNIHFEGVRDSAYGGGWLALSELSQRMNETFCALCHLGIVSAGDVSGKGSAERTIIVQHLTSPGLLGFGGEIPQWSDSFEVGASLYYDQPDGTKQHAVSHILHWYALRHIQIPDANAFFFDDRTSNVAPFRDTPYNARQISCGSRDRSIGYCGALPGEILSTTGTWLCGDPPKAPTLEPVPNRSQAVDPGAAGTKAATYVLAANALQDPSLKLGGSCGSPQCATEGFGNRSGYICGDRIRWLRWFEQMSAAVRRLPHGCGRTSRDVQHVCSERLSIQHTSWPDHRK